MSQQDDDMIAAIREERMYQHLQADVMLLGTQLGECGAKLAQAEAEVARLRAGPFAWMVARAELLRRITAELATSPEGEKSIWYLSASAGDMTEFATMLGVIDEVLGAERMDWIAALREAGDGGPTP